MKPLIISFNDIRGGASISAFRLHKGLLKLGHNSQMFVAQKFSNLDSVIKFKPSTDLSTRLKRRLKRERNNFVLKRYPAGVLAKHEFFSLPSCEHGYDVIRQMPNADIFNLHFFTGFIDLEIFFKQCSPKAPIVWTLHDMNAITGGCHYDHECGKFSKGCTACPILESNKKYDLSYKIWRQKECIYSSIAKGKLAIVTPSKWLAEQVKKRPSLADKMVTVIPYGLDIDVFHPMDKQAIRNILGIPENSVVILFVAHNISSRRKGLSYLLDALAGMDKSFPLFLLTVGEGAFPADQLQFPSLPLGNIGNEVMMAMAYNAADVFVMPSLYDNLPNTVMESLACGTPVVAFDAGGIPEMVRNGITGTVVPKGDSRALRDAILELIEDEKKRMKFSENCRRIAEEEYNLELQAKRYWELFGKVG